MIQKLIKLLGGYTQEDFQKYKQDYKKKLSELTIARKQCGSINLDIKWIDEISKKERANLLSEADNISSREAFGYICNELKKQQIYYIAQEAADFNQMNFGRGTLNGISLLQDEIEELAALNRQENQQEEDYNPFNLIS